MLHKMNLSKEQSKKINKMQDKKDFKVAKYFIVLKNIIS